MYVCLCNAFTDKCVTRAIREGGARSVEEVYAALDCEPNCGRCKEMIADMLAPETAGLSGFGLQPAFAGAE